MSSPTGISTVAKFLLKELEKRFLYVLDLSSTIDAVYLAAILLNSAYRKLFGCLHSLDWITGMDYWTGTLDYIQITFIFVIKINFIHNYFCLHETDQM